MLGTDRGGRGKTEFGERKGKAVGSDLVCLRADHDRRRQTGVLTRANRSMQTPEAAVMGVLGHGASECRGQLGHLMVRW